MIHWSRLSAFLCLCGLAAFLPAIFVPAMLVANALEGPRWYSVWTGIRKFHDSGHDFLAGLIFCFSIAFPLVKFGLGLLCTAGRRFLRPGLRRGIVKVTSGTAKYSMLDVMVIAMAVMLVQVNDYVRILPSLGLYLFSSAILCSALASAALERALAKEVPGEVPEPVTLRQRLVCAVVVLAGLGAALQGAFLLRNDDGGNVQTITLTRLTSRGEMRRSVEKTLALKELAAEEHDFFSKDTVRRLLEFGQAVSTDAGWKAPEAWVAVDTRDGRTVESNRIEAVNLDEPQPHMDFTLTEAVTRDQIAGLRLVSNVHYLKYLNAPIDEESIRADQDPFRAWTRRWHGRIFSFDLQGKDGALFGSAVVWLCAGSLVAMWGLASLLTPAKP